MLNKVTLIGNLANFSLATNESYKDRNGNWQKNTEWHDIVMWRTMAERAKILRKGMLVYIEGKLTHRKWTDKEGREHYTTEITADVLRILEKREHSQGSSHSAAPEKADNDPQNIDSNHIETSEDDLPF
jgi:single-strand DNA-binding protein